MAVTDDEVLDRQQQISDLRQQVADAKLHAETAFKERDNEITMAALDREEERLQAELQQYQAITESVDDSVARQVQQVSNEGAPTPDDAASGEGDVTPANEDPTTPDEDHTADDGVAAQRREAKAASRKSAAKE